MPSSQKQFRINTQDEKPCPIFDNERTILYTYNYLFIYSTKNNGEVKCDTPNK